MSWIELNLTKSVQSSFITASHQFIQLIECLLNCVSATIFLFIPSFITAGYPLNYNCSIHFGVNLISDIWMMNLPKREIDCAAVVGGWNAGNLKFDWERYSAAMAQPFNVHNENWIKNKINSSRLQSAGIKPNLNRR